MIEKFPTWKTVEVAIAESSFWRRLFYPPLTKKIELIKIPSSSLGFEKLHTRHEMFERAESFQLEPVPFEVQTPYQKQYQFDPDWNDRPIWAFGFDSHFDSSSLIKFIGGKWVSRPEGISFNHYCSPEQLWVFARQQKHIESQQ